MMEEQHNDLLARLHLCRLSYPDFVALQLAYYERRHFESAPGWARTLCDAMGLPAPTTGECNDAFKNLIERGSLQIIDAAAIASIREHLQRHPAHGPVCGLPFLEQLDLTLNGYDLWRRLWIMRDGYVSAQHSLNSCTALAYRKRRQVIIYSYTESDAIEHARESEFAVIGNTEYIGQWRADWWKVIPSGVRLRCVAPPDT